MPKRFVENAMKDYMGKKSGQIPDHPAHKPARCPAIGVQIYLTHSLPYVVGYPPLWPERPLSRPASASI